MSKNHKELAQKLIAQSCSEEHITVTYGGRMKGRGILTLSIVCCALANASRGGLSFYVDPNSPWPAGWYSAAVSDMQTVVNMYNAYGDFGSGSIYVYYNAGIPTAQSGYGASGGSIGVGGTYPNVRVLLHESSHWLGTGTYSNYWSGPHASALMQQFDGVGAVLNGDGQHYWPYGENYDNESSAINDRRHVAMVYALREDFGIGSTAPPSAATNVTLKGNDNAGESGFNYPWNWSDDHFAQAGTNYSTGNFALRTPTGYPSWTFAGSSLTVNNKTNPSAGLLFNGWGTTGVVTIRNLILDGGTIKHDQYPQDLFQLAGNVTLASNSTVNAANGPIKILASVSGPGGLTKTGPYTLTMSGNANYTGNTTISGGTLQLAPVAPVASYSFDNVSGSTVVNGGSGGTGMNGALANGATIVSGGQAGNAVRLANGGSVNINNPITDLGNQGNWTVSAWVKTTTPGATILTKGDGTGWSNGNTIFYLGDGTGGGSGGIPSGVRYAGGFFQGSTGARVVNNNAWHQVTYVNSGGAYGIYVDGVAQPLSAGNGGFGNADVGSVVRLGVTTDTFAGDGTVNFNGLMDDVRFYNQALSASQVGALYQGKSVTGNLPSNTNVTIAAGAVLDVNGVTQTIGTLTGPSGSAVKLGAGQLTVSSASSSSFAGTISGAGSLTKGGTGSLTLSGNNTYSGITTVNAGTLRVSGSIAGSSGVTVNGGGTFEAAGGQTIRSAVVNDGSVRITRGAPGNPATQLTIGDGTQTFADASTSALSIGGGTVDVSDNGLVLRFAPGSGAAAAGVIRGYLGSARNGGDWRGPGIAADEAIADPGDRAVGYTLSSELLGTSGGSFMGGAVDGSSVLVRATVIGDATLDGEVDFADLVRLAQNYNSSGAGVGWFDGDFNYDGTVDFNDLVGLAQHYDAAMPAGPVAGAPVEFQGDLVAAFAGVPEPSAVGLMGLFLAMGCARNRKRRRRRGLGNG
jgi:autotransporter-associated beta strand protein